jgi:hypothetical protein
MAETALEVMDEKQTLMDNEIKYPAIFIVGAKGIKKKKKNFFFFFVLLTNRKKLHIKELERVRWVICYWEVILK